VKVIKKFALVVCIVLLAMPILVACTEKTKYFTVNFDFRDGGSVVVEIDEKPIAHATSHAEGSVITIVITPDAEYKVLSVMVGTVDLLGENGFFTLILEDNVTLRVRFTPLIV